MSRTTSSPAGASERVSARPVYILGIVALLAVAGMVAALWLTAQPSAGEFVPPAFDSMAEVGIPAVPEGLGYWSPYREGMAYRISVCGSIRMDGEEATVYFTSWAENTVYLKLRVLDAEGNILGESGLLKPGEYVRSVCLREPLPVGTAVILKVMGYEPDTYRSAGSMTVNTIISE